jgi:hypothetical protein
LIVNVHCYKIQFCFSFLEKDAFPRGTFLPPPTEFLPSLISGKSSSPWRDTFEIRLTDTLPNSTCKLHTEWNKTNLLNVGSDLGAGVGEGAVAGPAGGGAVGGVAQLPAQAAVHVAHLLNHSHSQQPFIP